jgi:hypothetical protein
MPRQCDTINNDGTAKLLSRLVRGADAGRGAVDRRC